MSAAFTKATVAERFWIGWNGGGGETLIPKTNTMYNSGWRVHKLALTR